MSFRLSILSFIIVLALANSRHSSQRRMGTTEFGGGGPLASNTLWQIGSKTKAFTAVTLLQLEAEHEHSIRDTVRKWLPQYPA